jgi:hypothetical protein
MDLIPLITFKEVDLNTILLAAFGAIGTYYMRVIKTDVNSNTKSAAVREEALRMLIKSRDATISDLREQRAASGGPPVHQTEAPSPPLVVQMDATVGPKVDDK